MQKKNSTIKKVYLNAHLIFLFVNVEYIPFLVFNIHIIHQLSITQTAHTQIQILNSLTWRVEDLLCSTGNRHWYLISSLAFTTENQELWEKKKNQWTIITFHPVFSQHFSQSFCYARHFDPQPSVSPLNIYQGLLEKGAVTLPLLIHPGTAGPWS